MAKLFEDHLHKGNSKKRKKHRTEDPKFRRPFRKGKNFFCRFFERDAVNASSITNYRNSYIAFSQKTSFLSLLTSRSDDDDHNDDDDDNNNNNNISGNNNNNNNNNNNIIIFVTVNTGLSELQTFRMQCSCRTH